MSDQDGGGVKCPNFIELNGHILPCSVEHPHWYCRATGVVHDAPEVTAYVEWPPSDYPNLSYLLLHRDGTMPEETPWPELALPETQRGWGQAVPQ